MVYTSFSSKTEAEAETTNRLMSAALFTTLAVTIWTTALIAYRVYSTPNLNLSRKQSQFYNILEVIMQSSFMFSLALVPSAVIAAVPVQQSNFATLYTASNYLLDAILSGITVC